jgi:hypothetical protein
MRDANDQACTREFFELLWEEVNNVLQKNGAGLVNEVEGERGSSHEGNIALGKSPPLSLLLYGDRIGRVIE